MIEKKCMLVMTGPWHEIDRESAGADLYQRVVGIAVQVKKVCAHVRRCKLPGLLCGHAFRNSSPRTLLQRTHMACQLVSARSHRGYSRESCTVRRVACVNVRRTVSMEASSGSQATVAGTRSTEGKAVGPQSLRIQRLVGQGSFGEVFEVSS